MAAKYSRAAFMADQQVAFDLKEPELALYPFERSLGEWESVEDIKGAEGQIGKFRITNARGIWINSSKSKINIVFGLHTVIHVKKVTLGSSRLGVGAGALEVLVKYNGSKFALIFTPVAGNRADVATLEDMLKTVDRVYRAHTRSVVYRDLKLKASMMDDAGQIILLPEEQLCRRQLGVWNLAADMGNLGSMVVTNIRVLWWAETEKGHNVSIPYLQIESVVVRDSKFGEALVIKTTEPSGGYVLGFKLDPKEALDSLCADISSRHKAYNEAPIWGVNLELGDGPVLGLQEKVDTEEDSTASGKVDPAGKLQLEEIQHEGPER